MNDPPLSIDSVFHLTRGLARLRDILNPIVGAQILASLYESLYRRVTEMSDDELKAIDPSQLESSIKFLRLLAYANGVALRGEAGPATPRGWDKNYVAACEKLLLRFHLILLKSPTLAKQVHGANGIKNIISICTSKEEEEQESASKTGASASKKDSSQRSFHSKWWINSSSMCEWVVENNVCQVMLDRNAHDEVVKRSEHVLNFLASHNCFDPVCIDMLWNHAVDKHEHTVNIMFQVVLSLTRHLCGRDCEAVFRHIYAIPLNEYRRETLKLVYGFSLYMLQRIRHPKGQKLSISDVDMCPLLHKARFGAEVLWSVVFETGVASAERDTAAKHLQGLMRMPTGKPFRSHYATECVKNLKEDKCLLLSIRCLILIVETYPDISENEDVRSDVINRLQTELKLFSVVMRLIEEGKHSSEELHATLSLLEFLFENSSSGVPTSCLDSVWNIVTSPTRAPEDKNAAMDWIARLCPTVEEVTGNSGRADRDSSDTTDGGDEEKNGGSEDDATSDSSHSWSLSREMSEYVFRQKLQSLPVNNFNQSSLNGFQLYFELINSLNGSLTVIANSNGSDKSYLIHSLNIEGIRVLWQVALHCSDDHVREVASDMLISLYSSDVVRPLSESDVKESFIETCMREFPDDVHTVTVEDETTTSHILDLLERFLLKCDGDLTALIDEHEIDVCVRFTKKSMDQMTFTVHPAEKVGAVLLRISESASLPLSVLRAFTNGREVKDINANVLDIAREGEVKLVVHQRPGAQATEAISQYQRMRAAGTGPPPTLFGKAPAAGSSQYASSILSQKQAYFEKLFHLLNINTVVGRVWGLICKLPRNAHFKDAIISMSTSALQSLGLGVPATVSSADDSEENETAHFHWESILDMDNIFRMQYSANIIHEYLFKKGADVSVRIAWAQQFVANGGFEHVCNILGSFEYHNVEAVAGESSGSVAAHVNEKLKVGIKCLRMLLEIYNSIVFEHLQSGNKFMFNMSPVLRSNVLTFDMEGVDQFPHIHNTKRPTVIIHRFMEILATVSSSPVSAEEMVVSTVNVEIPSSIAGAVEAMVPIAPAVHGPFLPGNDGVPVPPPVVAPSVANAVGASSASDQAGASVPSTKVTETDFSRITDVVMQLICGYIIYGQAADHISVETLSQGHVSWEDFMCVTLCANDPLARARARYGLLRICKKAGITIGLSRYSLRILNDVVQTTRLTTEQCDEFFTLYSDLLTVELKVSPAAATVERLFGFVYELLQRHRCTERTRHSEPDQYFIGLLRVLKELVSVCPSLAESSYVMTSETAKGALEYIFNDCLFFHASYENKSNAEGQSPPFCRTSASQAMAVDVLLKLAENSQRCWTYVVDSFANSFENDESPSSWAYNPSNHERGQLGYAGIRNLGCICYMIASLQQLFMVPTLREKLLTVKVPVPPSTIEEAEEHDDSDDYFFQIQRIFASLAKLDEHSADPTGFCTAYKDFDGEPVDVLIQMDANEFLNLLFDKMDATIRNDDQSRLLKNTFGGAFCNQIICDECGHVSENREPFYTMSVGVKGKHSLTEALDAFVQGEKLTGGNMYRCAKCEKKVNALKRVCVDTLPPTLVVHLKRFEFNYDTMQKLKINDECSFPPSIDMKPYTKAGLRASESKENSADNNNENEEEVESYHYELYGIVVHAGIADAGHYYSYIRERLPTGEAGQWFEFNDESVTPFDSSNIPKECYGGWEMREVYDTKTKKREWRNMPKSANAYMLLYERVDKPSKNELDYSEKDLVALRSQGFDSHSLPEAIDREMWNRNTAILRYRTQYSELFSNMMWRLQQVPFLRCAFPDYPYGGNPFVKIYPQSQWMKGVLVSFRYFVTTLVRREDRRECVKWTEYIIKELQASVPACVEFLKFLAQFQYWTMNMLFYCPHEENRKQFVRIVMTAIRVVTPFERHFNDKAPYGLNPELHHQLRIDAQKERKEQELAQAGGGISPSSLNSSAAASNENGMELEGDQDTEEELPLYAPLHYTSPSVYFIDQLVLMLPRSSPYWRSFDQYFELLSEYAKLGYYERMVLLNRHLPSELAAFFNGEESPFYSSRLGPTFSQKMGTEHTSPKLDSMLELLETLVCGSTRTSVGDDAANMFAVPSPTQLPGSSLVFPEYDRDYLLTNKFLNSLLRQKINPAALSKILQHWAWNDFNVSKFVLDIVASGIDRYDSEHYAPYFCVLSGILSLDDSLRAQRTEYALERIVAVVESNLQYIEASRSAILFLQSLCSSNVYVLHWFMKPDKRANIQMFEDFLEKHSS